MKGTRPTSTFKQQQERKKSKRKYIEDKHHLLIFHGIPNKSERKTLLLKTEIIYFNGKNMHLTNDLILLQNKSRAKRLLHFCPRGLRALHRNHLWPRAKLLLHMYPLCLRALHRDHLWLGLVGLLLFLGLLRLFRLFLPQTIRKETIKYRYPIGFMIFN